MKATKFAERISINHSAEAVFDYTQDYQKRLHWDLFLKKAVLTNGAKVADEGVRAYCVAKNGLGMLTEYITYKRPNVTAVKMIKGPFMFNYFLASWTFKEISNKKTEVVFLYSFSLRFPFNLITKFVKNNLRTNVKNRLGDLKKNMEL